MNNYKIVGICQVYNEIVKGNLERFVKHILPLVDSLVVYDDASSDGSFEYMRQFTPHIIRGSKNDFTNEVAHRKLLIDEALKLAPDFILWLDVDEVLTANAVFRLQELCQYCIDKNLDGISMHELNIWRSNTWRRIDSLYDILWQKRLWRVTENIRYTTIKPGLHQAALVPPSIINVEKVVDVAVIHYGFSSKKRLAYKYLIYKSHGQRGYDMLDRLIDEHTLELEKLPKEMFPDDLWVENDPKPEPLTFEQALSYVEEYKEEVEKPTFSIVCLIYKSTRWAKFVYQQVLKYTEMSNAEFFFVANDAEPEVLEYLKNNYFPHFVFQTTPEQKQEWYINNIYRAYNFGATQAKGDYLVFINSDMAFSPGWLEKLWSSINGSNCLSSRLVESGKLRTGQYGLEKDFGDIPERYAEKKFNKYAKKTAEPNVKEGGLYMPLLIKKDDFLNGGGYPEGNIIAGSDIFTPKIAKKGEPLVTGDLVLMQKLATKNIIHQTVFDSIVYHFQMGEMLDSSKKSISNAKIYIAAICNDLLIGIMGERVFWGHLLESLPAVVGIDDKTARGKGDYANRARKYIQKHYPDIPIIIQNSTFIGPVDPKRYTIMFLQDNLRAMDRKNENQELNLKLGSKLVANSISASISYPEYDFEIIPLGIDDQLFKPMDKKDMREKYGFGQERIGIFVGSFSEVKGWSKIRECISEFQNITWIVVSKYDETFTAPNVKLYNRVPQQTLAELYNCADFFILGSPVETQGLAALEACLCDIPVIMIKTGIFASFTDEERSQLGIFSDDFSKAIEDIQKLTFSPRQIIIDKKLTISACIEKWNDLIAKAMIEIESEKYSEYRSQGTSIADQEVYYRWRHPVLSANIEFFKDLYKNTFRFLQSIYFLRCIMHFIRKLFSFGKSTN